MKTIHKYIIQKESYLEKFTIFTSVNGRALDAQIQNGELCIWIEINSSHKCYKEFGIFGTGHPIPEFDVRYISTVQEGGLVWHIYEYL